MTKKNSDIKLSTRRSATIQNLDSYCYFAKENDFAEVCEWENGEGYDLAISAGVGDKHISLTYGEFRALKHLVKALDKGV